MTSRLKLTNEYSNLLGPLYATIPKAVLAAIAISALTSGDHLDEAPARVLAEWRVLHQNGIVPQAPPRK